MAEGLFNSIAILDAIPDIEFNTARRLLVQLRDLADYQVEGLVIKYFKINAFEDIQSSLSSLRSEAELNGLKPWVHIEGHGLVNETGMVTANGSPVLWSQLKSELIPLNVATNLNVVLILATCFGGSFVRAINTTDRAPVLGLIGPMRELTAGELEIDFKGFYKNLFLSGALSEAVSALTTRAGDNLYYRETADGFFFTAWAGYKQKHATPSAVRERAKKIYRRVKNETGRHVAGVGSIKRSLKSKEKSLFEKFRNRYFMYDVDSNNITRFPITYNDAEKYAGGR